MEIILSDKRKDIGTKTTYSPNAVNGKSVSVDIGFADLDVEFHQPEKDGPIEVSLTLTDASGAYQDIALVRTVAGAEACEVLVWGKKDDENHSDSFYIPSALRD